MGLRSEFVALAGAESVSIRELCRRFGVSPATGYKWLRRAAEAGGAGLADRSRRPRTSPHRTAAQVEALVLAVRDEHPNWGGRKIAARLRTRGHAGIPSPSTVTEILRRHGRLAAGPAATHAWQRFERDVPNQLWQMDFKGHVPLGQRHGRLHPLTVLDDHSRFCLVLGACANEQLGTVQERLVVAFRRYGLPDRVLMDNGSPWGAPGKQVLTQFDAWLLRLGVGVSHGRPYHPQTQGKEERFHRTLKAELLQGPPYRSLGHAQDGFDRWRDVYNLERPHEACSLQPPVSRYRPSERAYPETLPALDYAPDMLVRRIHNGRVSLNGQKYWLSEALEGHQVGLLQTPVTGVWDIYLGPVPFAVINENDPEDGWST